MSRYGAPIPVTLTEKQCKALCRAWDVLHSGESITRYNVWDFTKRHETRDRAAARVIDELLDQAGYDEDAE